MIQRALRIHGTYKESEEGYRISKALLETDVYYWTTEPPTEPGWYWVQTGIGPVVGLVGGASDYSSQLVVRFAHMVSVYELSNFRYWLGPLPEPEPPKE